MEYPRTVNLANLKINQLKEMLKQHKRLPQTIQRDEAIASIEREIKNKKNRPLPEDHAYLHKKLDTYRQIFKYSPERFKAIKLGLG